MKNRLRKLNFLKSFNSTRPILILALIFILIVTFVNQKPIKNARAASYTYTENFSSKLLDDTFATNAEWDTAIHQVRLLRNQLGAENISSTSANGVYQIDSRLDSSDNPYLVWGDNSSGITNIFFSKLTIGVGWTKMDGTLGHDNISNSSIGCYDPQILLDSSDNPNVIFTCANTYFTKWSPLACGGAGCWTKMDGVTPGKDTLTGIGSKMRMDLDSSDNPYIVGSSYSTVNFVKWTPGTGWTNMDGATVGIEILFSGSNNYPQILLEKTAPLPTPNIVYYSTGALATNIEHIKWTYGSLLCGNPVGCWTNMAENSTDADNVSNDNHVNLPNRRVNQFQLDLSDNPYIIWQDTTGLSQVSDIYFAKWTPGPGLCSDIAGCWTKMNGIDLSPDNITNTLASFKNATDGTLHIDNSNSPYISWTSRFPYANAFTNTGDIFISRWNSTGCAGAGCWTNMAGIKKCFYGTNNGTTCTNNIDCTGGGICRGFDNLSNNATVSLDPVLAFNSAFSPYVIWGDDSPTSIILITKWTVGAGPGVCGVGINDCWTNMNGTLAGYENPVGTSNISGANAQLILNTLDQPNIFFVRNSTTGRDVYYTKYLTGYTYQSTAQSLKVNAVGVSVGSATLTTTQTDSPPNQTIDYYLSNNGGVNWEPVTLGIEHVFLTSGNDLRWRAVLQTTDSNFTPILDDLSITYYTPTINCGVIPANVSIGSAVTINATTTFAPAPGVNAQIYNDGNLLATIPLVNIGGFNYSASLPVTSIYNGTNDVVINATDPGPPLAYVCNTIFRTTGSSMNPQPSAPRDLTCSAISSGSIRWNFTDTATNETGFRLYGPEGMILDTGGEITTDLSHLDETGLLTNTLYPDRFVKAFNGAGESGPTEMASCFTLAKIPTVPNQISVNNSSINISLDPNDGNPPATEYAIKELTTGKYVDANGLFLDTEAWQTYDNWGGSNGINIIGNSEASNPNQYTAQYKMALTPGTNYQFSVKARNGDGVETAFSPALNVSTTGSTPTGGGGVTISATKGVAINLAYNFTSKFFKTVFAQTGDQSESRYITLLREFSFLLNIILIILVAFLLISIYSSLKYLSKNSAAKKYFSLIWALLTKEPAYVFSIHAPRDEVGTFQSSFQKHRQAHIFTQKTLMRTLGLIIIKLIILAVLIFGLSGFNHSSSAQMSSYNQSGATVNVGDKLSYLIEIQNTSTVSAGDFVLNDLLDTHLSYISGSAKATINSNSFAVVESFVNQSLILRLSDIPANSTANIIFDTKVKPSSEGAIISNFAEGISANGGAFTTNTVTNPVRAAAIKYSCSSSYQCVSDEDGAYSSLSSCQSACIAPSVTNTNLPPPVCPNPPCQTPPPVCTGPGCETPPIPPITPGCTGPNCVTPPTPPVIPPSTPPQITPIPIINTIIDIITEPQTKIISQNIITPILIAVAAINTIPMTILLTTYLLPYLHLLFVEPLLFLFRRKRKKWGVVYNALSKMPVDLAVVRLFRAKDNKLLQTRVTDKQGRYIFIVKEPGKYYISVIKNGFFFPTKYLSFDKQDAKYIDLYHGEAIEVTDQEAVITANVPLDPSEKKIMPERQVIFGYLFKNLRLVISYVGLILAGLIFLIYPTWITGISILFHILLFTIFMRLLVPPKPKSWGIVYDQKTKEPLHYAIVRIFDIKFNKLLETQVTDSKGRYSFLVSKNQYQLLAEKIGYANKEIKPVDLVEKEEIVDLDLGLNKK
jgi:uncharacterized repeat protein (TIGR01451 family)